MIQPSAFRLPKSLERLEIVSFIEINSQVYFSKINLATNQSNSNMINSSLRQQEHAYRSAVSVEEFLLEETESTMFLRIYLDQRLSWCNNVDSICASVASDIFAMKHWPNSVVKKFLVHPTSVWFILILHNLGKLC